MKILERNATEEEKSIVPMLGMYYQNYQNYRGEGKPTLERREEGKNREELWNGKITEVFVRKGFDRTEAKRMTKKIKKIHRLYTR